MLFYDTSIPITLASNLRKLSDNIPPPTPTSKTFNPDSDLLVYYLYKI